MQIVISSCDGTRWLSDGAANIKIFDKPVPRLINSECKETFVRAFSAIEINLRAVNSQPVINSLFVFSRFRFSGSILPERFGAIFFATSSDQITQSHNLENGVVFQNEFIIRLLVFVRRRRFFSLRFEPSRCTARVWKSIIKGRKVTSANVSPFSYLRDAANYLFRKFH